MLQVPLSIFNSRLRTLSAKSIGSAVTVFSSFSTIKNDSFLGSNYSGVSFFFFLVLNIEPKKPLKVVFFFFFSSSRPFFA